MKTFGYLFLISPAAIPALYADSLWTAPGSSEHSMVADHKASKIGDILTISVQESANTAASQRTKTDTTTAVDASLSTFLFPGVVTKNGLMPAVKGSGTNSFSGGGDIANSQTISATAAVLVTDVLPNGNLVIEGVRRLTFAGETQHIVLHGIVRPDDVSSGNFVASSNIADARVEFISEGSITDAAKKGWLTKLYEKLRPY